MSVWLKMSLKYCLPAVPVLHFWPKLTHPAARSLCDSLSDDLTHLLPQYDNSTTAGPLLRMLTRCSNFWCFSCLQSVVFIMHASHGGRLYTKGVPVTNLAPRLSSMAPASWLSMSLRVHFWRGALSLWTERCLMEAEGALTVSGVMSNARGVVMVRWVRKTNLMMIKQFIYMYLQR